MTATASPWPAAPREPPHLAARRALILGAGGRFCGVTFRKKDGSVRRMQVQPAALGRRLKGAAASEGARRAAAARAERHPHLLPVWDVRARAPRSVNLDTLTRVAVDGRVHRFGDRRVPSRTTAGESQVDVASTLG